MRLSDYIESKISDLTISQAKRSQLRSVQKTLSEHLGDAIDDDILQIVTPGWVERYYKFLSEDYTSRKSHILDQKSDSDRKATRQRIADDNLSDFRQLVSGAIADSMLPDIDIFAEMPKFRRRRAVKNADYDYDADLRSAIIASSSLPAHWFTRYLISICLAGLPQDLLADTIAPLEPQNTTLYLPHLGVNIDTPPALAARILLYREDVAKYRQQASTQANTLSTASTNPIHRLLASLGATRLHASGSTFTDWLLLLRYIIDADQYADIIPRIVNLYLSPNKTPSPQLATAIAKLAKDITAKYLNTMAQATAQYWYAIKTYGITAEDLMHTLHSLDDKNPIYRGRLRGNIYCPCRKLHRTKTNVGPLKVRRPLYDTKRAVLKNILFLHANDDLASHLADQLTSAWIFRNRRSASRRFIHISPDEISQLQTLLNYVSDYSDLSITITEAPAEPRQLNPQDQVTILIPGYGQYQATVSKRDNKKSTAERTYYKITFRGDNRVAVEMSLPSDLLQLTHSPGE